MSDICYAVKDEDGYYWCGLNKWDKQLRKAQLFHSLKYANAIVEKFAGQNLKIVKVEIKEVKDE